MSWGQSCDELQRIRREVFIEEQGVPEKDEWDEYDPVATHFLAVDASTGGSVGTARLLPSGKITRMAIQRPHRRQKIGSQLLSAVCQYAKAQGFKTVYLDSQMAAAEFYELFGFVREGAVFQDAGIAHIRMTKTESEVDMNTEADESVQPLQHPSDALQFIREFAFSALRRVDIFSHQLSPGIYADAALIDAISQLARRGAQTQVRILVRDTKPLYGADHPLVRLAQRLPSHVHIKAYTEGANNAAMGFFCADASNLVHFLDEPNLSGYARRNARAESRHLLTEFEHLWLYGSRPDSNLRQLSL